MMEFETVFKADATWTYAVKDGQELKMDWYAPSELSPTCLDGVRKPVILFIFGGGFKKGERSGEKYMGYFSEMTRRGYGIVTIDYRLGFKDRGPGKGLEFFRNFYDVIHLASDDLVDAVNFLSENPQLGIDTGNLVICGTSAGALTAMQTIWEGSTHHGNLPEGFAFKGLMTYSGGVISKRGKPSFNGVATPFLLFHGTADRVVPYGARTFLRAGFFGSGAIAQFLERDRIPHWIFRYEGNGHEVSAIMARTVEIQDRFISSLVIKKEDILLDTLIKDSTIEKWKPLKTSELY